MTMVMLSETPGSLVHYSMVRDSWSESDNIMNMS